MEYLAFTDEEHDDFKVGILTTLLDYAGLLDNYIQPTLDKTVDLLGRRDFIAYKAPMIPTGNYKKKFKTPSVTEQREFLLEFLPTIRELGVKYLYVSEPKYFKTLTGCKTAQKELGAVKTPDIKHFPEFLDMRVVYLPNHKMAFFDPIKTHTSIKLGIAALNQELLGTYLPPGTDILKQVWIPRTIAEIKRALRMLIVRRKAFSCDIEAFSLDIHDAGIATIAFGLDKHTAVTFQVDPAPGIKDYVIRGMLIDFFLQTRKQKKLYHSAAYDVTVLIHQLNETVPMMEDSTYVFSSRTCTPERFFDVMTDTSTLECTKIISYLATNSCAGNKLGLKDQAIEFAGNYAVDDIKDVTKIPLKNLLIYNAVDAIATWFVYEKNKPKMIADDQEEIYNDIFIPSLVDVVDMQLTGLPVDMDQVAESKKEITAIQDAALAEMHKGQIVQAFIHHLNVAFVAKRNSELKTKQITLADVNVEFNPNSDQQLQKLLFDPDFMDFPVLDKTDSGAPSTNGTTLKNLKNHTKDPVLLDFLTALADFKDTAILLSTFIPALENARMGPDGNYYMHGNFNLGGTVSGRLSSSDPNLQNIPSKSRLAKYIKKCIRAPKGWLFVGLDFDSLEDKISALLTKDPNKLKVYTDGYDGHSLRAHSYFGHQMPDIDPNSVESINSIADLYPELRQDSKAPTFLLTYGGTFHGLMKNCGFSKTVAKMIEANYHTLYVVSDEWVASNLNDATKNGYVTAAFGLKVRTPILHQVILGNNKTPTAAKAESRTAGNALGQSWGLLNNRAASKFMKKVRVDRGLRQQIRICCQIHDAQYYLIKADIRVLKWFNDTLVKSVTWQDHPAIQHDEVKLSGKTSIFYPTWAEEHQIPNGATIDKIKEIDASIMAQYSA